jgi:hypothetical protein
MKTSKKNGSGMVGVMAMLSPARKREILDEVSGEQLSKIFAKAKTVGTFLAAVQAHPQAEHIRSLPMVRPANALPQNGVHRPRRRVLGDALLGQVLAIVKKNPGSRSEVLQQKTDIDRKTWKAALTKLRATKQVKTRGNRRATTYTAA